MMWFVIMQILSTIIECIWLGRKTDREKDLEILLLRRQLDIVDRARDKPLRISRVEKLTLAVLALQLKAVTGWQQSHVPSNDRIAPGLPPIAPKEEPVKAEVAPAGNKKQIGRAHV